MQPGVALTAEELSLTLNNSDLPLWGEIGRRASLLLQRGLKVGDNTLISLCPLRRNALRFYLPPPIGRGSIC